MPDSSRGGRSEYQGSSPTLFTAGGNIFLKVVIFPLSLLFRSIWFGFICFTHRLTKEESRLLLEGRALCWVLGCVSGAPAFPVQSVTTRDVNPGRLDTSRLGGCGQLVLPSKIQSISPIQEGFSSVSSYVSRLGVLNRYNRFMPLWKYMILKAALSTAASIRSASYSAAVRNIIMYFAKQES